MQLTDDQNKALSAINLFFQSEERTFGLLGAAGTGKTSIIKYAMRYWDYNIKPIAPTHKAKSILNKSLKSGNSVEFDRFLSDRKVYAQTLHLFLQLVPKYNVKGKKEFVAPDNMKRKYNPKWDYMDAPTLLIIDECSMISDILFELLEEYLEANPRDKILFVGDDFQLNPVNSSEEDDDITTNNMSKVFQNIGMRNVTLTQQCRANTSELANLFRHARESVMRTDLSLLQTYLANLQYNPDIIVHNNKLTFLNDITTTNHKEVQDEITICCSNEQRNVYAKHIFEKVYHKKFRKGQKFTVTEYFRHKGDRDKYPTAFYSSDELELLSHSKVDCISKYFDIEIKCDKFTFPHKYNKHFSLYKPIETENEKFKKATKDKRDEIKKRLKSIKNPSQEEIDMLWGEYEFERNKIKAPIQLRTAYTVYKSQGATFNTTFVDIDDILRCREKCDLQTTLKEIYVALTRSSNRMSILYSDCDVPQNIVVKCSRCKLSLPKDNFKVRKTGKLNKCCKKCIKNCSNSDSSE